MFADSFQAFEQIPEFFRALTPDVGTIDEVRAILDRLGARDLTERTSPYAGRASTPHPTVRDFLADWEQRP